MKSADDLKARIGGNMRESMGAHRPGVPAPTGPALHGETAKFRGASRLRDALSIDVDRIVPDPDQPRKEFDPVELDRLAGSLKVRGQLQPIRARYEAGSDRWVVIAGERRYRAAIIAGLPSLVVIEAKGPADPDDILEDQLVENCLREDLKPIEQAKAFRALIDRRGWSYRQLSEHLHVAPASVARALALLDLPDDLQGRVEAGQLAPSVAYEVSRIDDQTEQREIADRIATEGLNRAETVEAVRQARTKPERIGKGRGTSKAARPLPKERSIKVDGFKVSVEGRKGFDERAMLDVLNRAAELLTAKLEQTEGPAQSAA